MGLHDLAEVHKEHLLVSASLTETERKPFNKEKLLSVDFIIVVE